MISGLKIFLSQTKISYTQNHWLLPHFFKKWLASAQRPIPTVYKLYLKIF